LVLFFSDYFVLSVEIHPEVANGQDGDGDDEAHQLFTPYRGYCARKGVSKVHAIHVESSIVWLR
jgi:hypothetical protein